MTNILGIDTGGTYTDSVVVQSKTKEILYKAKTLTTKTNLEECIKLCFAAIPPELLKEVSMVCLSTTLATNAIVENRGCKEGLILIGNRPKGKIPANRVAVVKGKYDIKGRIKENLDTEEIGKVIDSFEGKVDAIAISGYASVRNPEHERYVKGVIETKLGIPVVCAHELTSTLGFYDRTITTVLNARLIPMVCELIDAVKSVIKYYNLEVPLMIVKGDGGLMTDICARNKPIETILSGPAASIKGGLHLSGERDAIVMDIGGTTTDIANVTANNVTIRDEGAKVGGWFTHVKAAEVYTVGLGGDSRIYIDSCGNIQIGPEKSVPFSMAVTQYPELLDEIKDIYATGAYQHFCQQDDEAYRLVKKYKKISYSNEENIIIEILRHSPHTLWYIEENVQIPALKLHIDSLIKVGAIERISLTPTDLLHTTGKYRKWNVEAAEIILNIVAYQYKKSTDNFTERLHQKITDSLDLASIQAGVFFDNQETTIEEGSLSDYFINRLFFEKNNQVLQASYSLDKKIVAIGAPATAWARDAGKKLNTEVIVPAHAEVANAVGAAIGRAEEKIEILIRPDTGTDKYFVYSPIKRSALSTLEDATEYAVELGKECALRLSEGRNYEESTGYEDVCIDIRGSNEKIFVERVVTVWANYFF